MANRKLTALPELTGLDDNDLGYVVDISDTSESPQGTSKKLRFSTIWDYIRWKADARYGTVKVIKLERFTSIGQICTLPTGSTATFAYIDGYIQYPEQAGFETDLNTFTQDGDEVTFKTTLDGTPQILIQYYL
jgi:hypothetical protein